MSKKTAPLVVIPTCVLWNEGKSMLSSVELIASCTVGVTDQ